MNRNLKTLLIGLTVAAALSLAAVPVFAAPREQAKYTCDYQGIPGAVVPLGPGLNAGVVNVSCDTPMGVLTFQQPVVFPLGDGRLIVGSLAEGSARDTTVYSDGSFRSQLRASGFSGVIVGPSGVVGPYQNVDINVQISFPDGSVPQGGLFPAPTAMPDRVHFVVTGRTNLPKNFLVNNR